MTAIAESPETSWISALPDSWPIVRNKKLLSESTTVSLSGAEELLSVSHITGITPKSEKKVTMIEAESLEGYRLVEPGDLVINMMWAWMGALGMSRYAGIVSPAYSVYRPKPGANVDTRYFDYLYRSDIYVMEMTRHSRGIHSSRLRIYPNVFLNLQVPQPPIEIQRAIAYYLDRETARIDTLIAEQQRLVEMLLERRQTAITVSTTDVQADVIQLVRCVTEQVDYRGATPPKTESGIQLVTARNVKSGWIDYESSQEFVDPDTYTQVMRRGLPKTDDILFTMEAPLGNVALVDREDIALAQRIIKWTLDRDQAHPRYLLYAMLGDEFQHQLRIRSTGSTALGIKASKLPELRVRLPPLDEQRRIAAYLDEQTAKIDTLIAETERFVELSRERRSALITAAVTGQVDVRGEVA